MSGLDLKERILRGLSDEQLGLVEHHLRKRFEQRKSRPGVTIVYDILYQCNLQYRGCSVSPQYINRHLPIPEGQLRPATAEVETALRKIKTYSEKTGKTCFVSFGGGEPFLRSDFERIVQMSAELFGSVSVGVDTNGVVEGELERIEALDPYFSYIGVSLDGLEDYHNWWRGGQVEGGAFRKTVELLKRLSRNQRVAEKLEVGSVATRKNIAQLPRLMEFLHDIGIRKYSVHRPMAVGRMQRIQDLIPDAQEFFDLLVSIVETAHRLGMDSHLHHSIESIYATLLLGLETHVRDKVGNPDAGSSLGIEPGGKLVFDPWSMRGLWMRLTGGNLLDPAFDLESALESDGKSVLSLARSYTDPRVRCHGCQYACSGGNRIAAAARYLGMQNAGNEGLDLTESHILRAMIEIDPACPFYDGNKM